MVRGIRNQFKRALLLSSSLLLLLSCGGDDSRIYNSFQSTENGEWQLKETKTFSLPRMKESQNVSLTLQLRTDNRYPYTNLTVIAEEKVIPRGKTITRTLRFPVAREKGTGIHETEFPINRIHLNKGDSLVVTFHHDMRRETLPGINDIGVEVKSEE